LIEVLQQIPHANKVLLPIEVTAPPLLAEFDKIEDTAVVVTVGLALGGGAGVLKDLIART
jgi:hypothetical protein